jgi:hypothetical protein
MLKRWAAMIETQKPGLIEAYSLRILPDITGVVDPARQFPEVAGFDSLQMPNAEFRLLRNRFEADSLSLPPGFEAENVWVHRRYNSRCPECTTILPLLNS